MSCVIDNNNFENGLTNVIYGLLEPSTNEIRYKDEYDKQD
jgi:hypothetical protein